MLTADAVPAATASDDDDDDDDDDKDDYDEDYDEKDLRRGEESALSNDNGTLLMQDKEDAGNETNVLSASRRTTRNVVAVPPIMKQIERVALLSAEQPTYDLDDGDDDDDDDDDEEDFPLPADTVSTTTTIRLPETQITTDTPTVAVKFRNVTNNKVCLGGQQWTPCGSSCPLTCDEPVKTCSDDPCVAKCQCPKEMPIIYNGQCITFADCPDIIVLRGSNIKLPCKIARRRDSKPTSSLKVTWFKDEALLESDDRISTTADGSLAIVDAEVDDSAIYRCETADKTICDNRRPTSFSHKLYVGTLLSTAYEEHLLYQSAVRCNRLRTQAKADSMSRALCRTTNCAFAVFGRCTKEDKETDFVITVRVSVHGNDGNTKDCVLADCSAKLQRQRLSKNYELLKKFISNEPTKPIEAGTKSWLNKDQSYHVVNNSCDPGFQQQFTSFCLPCEPGSFRMASHLECKSCAVDTYQSKYGEYKCNTCPPGTHNPRRGADNSSYCLTNAFLMDTIISGVNTEKGYYMAIIVVLCVLIVACILALIVVIRRGRMLRKRNKDQQPGPKKREARKETRKKDKTPPSNKKGNDRQDKMTTDDDSDKEDSGITPVVNLDNYLEPPGGLFSINRGVSPVKSQSVIKADSRTRRSPPMTTDHERTRRESSTSSSRRNSSSMLETRRRQSHESIPRPYHMSLIEKEPHDHASSRATNNPGQISRNSHVSDYCTHSGSADNHASQNISYNAKENVSNSATVSHVVRSRGSVVHEAKGPNSYRVLKDGGYLPQENHKPTSQHVARYGHISSNYQRNRQAPNCNQKVWSHNGYQTQPADADNSQNAAYNSTVRWHDHQPSSEESAYDERSTSTYNSQDFEESRYHREQPYVIDRRHISGAPNANGSCNRQRSRGNEAHGGQNNEKRTQSGELYEEWIRRGLPCEPNPIEYRPVAIRASRDRSYTVDTSSKRHIDSSYQDADQGAFMNSHSKMHDGSMEGNQHGGTNNDTQFSIRDRLQDTQIHKEFSDLRHNYQNRQIRGYTDLAGSPPVIDPLHDCAPPLISSDNRHTSSRTEYPNVGSAHMRPTYQYARSTVLNPRISQPFGFNSRDFPDGQSLPRQPPLPYRACAETMYSPHGIKACDYYDNRPLPVVVPREPYRHEHDRNGNNSQQHVMQYSHSSREYRAKREFVDDDVYENKYRRKPPEYTRVQRHFESHV